MIKLFRRRRVRILPGTITRILSWIPGINWISLIILGFLCKHRNSWICGLLYGFATLIFPKQWGVVWGIALIQYIVIWRKMRDELYYASQTAKIVRQERKIQQERKTQQVQKIQQERKTRQEQKNQQEQKKRTALQENTKKEIKGEIEPHQRNQYEAWKTEVDNGNAADTKPAFIYSYVYEIIDGCKAEQAQEGLNKLMFIWLSYRKIYTELDQNLYAWTFDFALMHHLDYHVPEDQEIPLPEQRLIRDLLIERYIEDKPLKLPFVLIDTLCDYSLTGSKFYKDGHQQLMQEAMTRVIALVDALTIKKLQNGILTVYGPQKAYRQTHRMFHNAECQNAEQELKVSVKAYCTSQKLRDCVNEAVRYGENVLREIKGYKGRLRGIVIEEETAELIENFLKKEYGAEIKAEPIIENTGVKLDFDNIERLRVQSDAVRDALTVEETKKELLTNLEEMKELLSILSKAARDFIEYLYKNMWECTDSTEYLDIVHEINRKSTQYLACSLIVRETGRLIVEDDYRDELEFIFVNQIEIPIMEEIDAEECTEEAARQWFSVQDLSQEMRMLLEILSKPQAEALYVILKREEVAEKIEKIAEEAMTMAEILIDEINEISTQYLDDILIDTYDEIPCLFEQYEAELLKAMK